jgi:hypothetical protein
MGIADRVEGGQMTQLNAQGLHGRGVAHEGLGRVSGGHRVSEWHRRAAFLVHRVAQSCSHLWLQEPGMVAIIGSIGQ